MARPKVSVLHLMPCERVEVDGPVGLDNPYLLRGVRYTFPIPPDTEFLAVLQDFWVYVRLSNQNGGVGRVVFSIDVVWLDGPSGPVSACYFPGLAVYFQENQAVVGRAWRFARILVPGEGRYAFRLLGRNGRRLAEDYIQIGRSL